MTKTSLSGKVAVVTGASSGIGEATARALAARGAAAVLAARNEERILFLEREISAAGGSALAVPTDVTDEVSVKSMVERAVAELRPDDLRYLFEVNVLGPLNCIQAALPHMERGGRVINVSSVVGKRAIPKVGAYCASKSALNALSDALRVEVAGAGITVTSVYPGTTRTSFRENSRRTRDETRGWRPKGVTPERVAQ